MNSILIHVDLDIDFPQTNSPKIPHPRSYEIEGMDNTDIDNRRLFKNNRK